jgi:hypothetical protein
MEHGKRLSGRLGEDVVTGWFEADEKGLVTQRFLSVPKRNRDLSRCLFPLLHPPNVIAKVAVWRNVGNQRATTFRLATAVIGGGALRNRGASARISVAGHFCQRIVQSPRNCYGIGKQLRKANPAA